MFAMGVERHISQYYDFVIPADFMELTPKMSAWIFIVTRTILLPCSRYPAGRIYQPFSLRIVACPSNQRADGVCNRYWQPLIAPVFFRGQGKAFLQHQSYTLRQNAANFGWHYAVKVRAPSSEIRTTNVFMVMLA